MTSEIVNTPRRCTRSFDWTGRGSPFTQTSQSRRRHVCFGTNIEQVIRLLCGGGNSCAQRNTSDRKTKFCDKN